MLMIKLTCGLYDFSSVTRVRLNGIIGGRNCFFTDNRLGIVCSNADAGGHTIYHFIYTDEAERERDFSEICSKMMDRCSK